MNQSLSGIPSIYFCGHEHCQPGHSFGPAVRPHYLIHVVLSGKGIFKHQGHTYSLKSGDSFLIKPMDSTYYEAGQTNPWEYAWIGFNGQEIPALLNQTCFQDSCIFICPPDSERKLNLRTLMHSILNTFSSANYNPFTLTGLFLELLGLMTGPSVVEGNSYSTQYVKRAMDYMKNNYGYNIRIQDIAAAIGIDRTYLYRLFMEQQKISPKQYLLQLRIHIASDMLSSSDYSITEIAYSCGFKDAAAFSNQFKKMTGYTPRKFREYLNLEKTIYRKH